MKDRDLLIYWTHDDWYENAPSEMCGQDYDNTKRAWDYQQAKIDHLEKDKEKLPDRIKEIISHDECNTYVMSCYLNSSDLYKHMRTDIIILCEYIKSIEELLK